MYELRDAFREAANREFAMIPPENELHHVFSPRFERKMRRLIRAEAKGYWKLIDTAAKRAVLVAALIAALLSTALAIRPVRQRVIQFFVEVYEEYFEIRFGREERGDIDPNPHTMERYTLTEIPDGYEETRFMEYEQFLRTDWENENGDKIILQQELGTQEIIMNGKGNDLDYYGCGELEIGRKQDLDTKIFIWEQDGYLFSMNVYEDFSLEKIAQMIGSLEKK